MSPAAIRLAVAAGCLVAAFGAGWSGGWGVNGWRLSSAYNAERVTQRDAAAEVLRLALADRDRKADTLRAANDTNLAKLQGAQDETNLLRTRLASGTGGLRVRAICPTAPVPQAAPASGVGDGAGAELDPAARRDYFALRDGINRVEAKLAACQDELRVRSAP